MFGLEVIARKIEVPPAGTGADLAIPCFREDPATVAEAVRSLKNPLFASVTVLGRYVNISLDHTELAQQTLHEALLKGAAYGTNGDGDGKTVMIEYSAPNIAKPMHMGHARNNAIGHSLVNIYRANGYRTVVTNHFGDWGMSLAKIMLAYDKWGDKAEFKKDPIRHLLGLYVRMTKEVKENLALEVDAKALFKKLEDGDPELRSLWQELRDISVADVKRIYDMLGIEFDLWHGESFYEPFIKESVDEALLKGAAKYGEPDENGGKPLVVDFEDSKLPSFLLMKSDGSSLYAARDIAVGRWRLKEYPKAEKIIYVVGHEQELYLKQIFTTLGMMGYPREKFEHVSYGVVTLDGKKISTRAGGVVFLEDGLKEAITRAKGIPEVGIGAVVYNMLSQGREHDIAFSWDAALNLQGSSAPYIQYAFVRAMKILGKAGGVSVLPIDAPAEAWDFALVKKIAFFPYAVRAAKMANAPHILATYANELAQEFNRFYANSPVLDVVDPAVRSARLVQVAVSAQTLKSALALLGISVPERM